MVEPLACCLHGVDAAGVAPGDTVAVIGLGPIGLMLCACIADAGGHPVGVGSRAERRALAPSFGAELGTGEGADVVIEAAGTTEAWELALELVRPGGTVLAFGGLPREAHVRVDPFRIHYEEVTLKGAFHHTPRHVRTALTFLGSGAYPFERLITHQLGLEGVAGLLADPPRDYLKARSSSRVDDDAGSAQPANSVSSGSRSPRRTARSTSTQRRPRASASVRACFTTFCRREHAAHAGHPRLGADPLEVARQLLDGVDRGDALDLDRDPAVLGVAAHQVDGADVGRPFPPHEPELLTECLRLGGELLLEVALDAVLRERGSLPHVVLVVAQDLDDPDVELVLGLARPLAHDDALERLALGLDHGRRRHPVLRLEPARIGVDEERAVRLQHQQAHGLGEDGVQAAGVDDLAAGDDEAHRDTVSSLEDMSRRPARMRRGVSRRETPFVSKV